ncbi:hypothetical protein [Sulfurospirillum oryzae]|uniref:hypothetical protein n=1 Tax=Sulfurospirillum oryzae TaxID=2976535 RepID=UPI0021E84C0E|nr:hypothetical protein [Sulfurospirillum oryzae]
MEKIFSLLTRISELYAIPQWAVNSGAIAICIILIAFPFVARYLMRPKYYKFRELILFKVLWRWKYKKGDVIGLWCYCPKCQSMLMVDDENCRSEETLQHKITYFVCPACGGNELGRVVGGDRRYVLSLVRREIWRHIREGTYNEVASATKEALDIYVKLEEAKAENNAEALATLEEKAESIETALEESVEEISQSATEECEDTLHVKDTELVPTDLPTSTKEEPKLSQEDRSAEEIEAVIREEKEIKKDGV